MLEVVTLGMLALCWAAWAAGFARARARVGRREKVKRAPVSRWGIALQMASFSFVCAYVRPPGFEKSWLSLVASIALGPPSVVLAWAALRHLGKQWRYEAALSADHELVRSGPYAWVRHPIYASMLGRLLSTGLAWTWWPMFVAALILFVAGTEIRVRAEDGLLAARFGEEFAAYRARVPAYIPLLR
ncbi:MAG TPA: isoprenylcysteine carboxylmethyltransferase family protein [Bryobacteraceae bacterium]|nr:isoprenylcysteine carboxylmethyltransferase family protein [Bryobacteraceae bacterium]